MAIKIHVLHTGKVYVSSALPFKDAQKNPNPVQMTLLMKIQPEDLDYVIMTHLHTDHASGLRQVSGAKHIVVSAEELEDTRAHPFRYVSSMWDGGYAPKSWQEMIPPGTALDEGQALRSLRWIREMSLDANCVESLANHDAAVVPHEILLRD